MRVFLGGTCNESTWRDEYIQEFKKHGITYFNPVVDDWDEKAQAREIKERKEADICLYTITPRISGMYSIAEAVEDAILRGARTIFNVEPVDSKYQFNEDQLKSLIQIGKMVQRHGGYFCAGLEQVIQVINHMKTPQKTLHNSDVSGAKKNVSDLKIVGNEDSFQLLCKASSEVEGWMKSTKAMDCGSSCLVQVTTQQRNPDGSYAIAEALALVPDTRIVPDDNNGRRLISRK